MNPRRSLLVRVYLWFLLALGLTLASTAALFVVLSGEDWQQRAREIGLMHTRLARDFAEHLLAEGQPPERVVALLEPVTKAYQASLVIVDANGGVRLELFAGADRPLALTPEQRQVVLDTGEWAQFGRGRAATFALPIALPGGERGVLAAALHGRGLQRPAGPALRTILGLCIILIVGLALSWPLVRSIVRPLEDMAAVADRLGGGELDARLRSSREDEIGQLAKTFNRMAEHIQALVESKQRLLGDVSHELRTPLARIKLATELARPGANDDARAYLDRIDRQASVLADMVDELLLYARLDAAAQPLEMRTLDAHAAISEVVQAFSVEAAAKDVRVSVDAKSGLALRIEPKLFQRALGNVLQNALAYSPAGGAVGIHAAGGRVTVEDQGPGVPDAELADIFRPFYRLDTARARETGGAGLGLAIVTRCMQAQGGSAHAERADGAGLRVVLTFAQPS